MPVVGYARVSTELQSLDAQRHTLTAAGCERTFEDTLWGVRDDRPGMAALLDYVRPGDTVVVVALDRLGPTLPAVISTVERLTQAAVGLRSIREGIDRWTPTGQVLPQIFAALADCERELARERAAAARQAGRGAGRPPRLSEAQKRQVRALRAGGKSAAELVRTFRVSQATVYRALQASNSIDAVSTREQRAGTSGLMSSAERRPVNR